MTNFKLKQTLALLLTTIANQDCYCNPSLSYESALEEKPVLLYQRYKPKQDPVTRDLGRSPQDQGDNDPARRNRALGKAVAEKYGLTPPQEAPRRPRYNLVQDAKAFSKSSRLILEREKQKEAQADEYLHFVIREGFQAGQGLANGVLNTGARLVSQRDLNVRDVERRVRPYAQRLERDLKEEGLRIRRAQRPASSLQSFLDFLYNLFS